MKATSGPQSLSPQSAARLGRISEVLMSPFLKQMLSSALLRLGVGFVPCHHGAENARLSHSSVSGLWSLVCRV